MLCLEWFDALLANMKAAGCALREENAAFSLSFTEPNDDPGPRLAV